MKKSIGTSAFLGAMCIAVTPIAPAYAANWVYVTENEKMLFIITIAIQSEALETR